MRLGACGKDGEANADLDVVGYTFLSGAVGEGREVVAR